MSMEMPQILKSPVPERQPTPEQVQAHLAWEKEFTGIVDAYKARLLAKLEKMKEDAHAERAAAEVSAALNEEIDGLIADAQRLKKAVPPKEGYEAAA